MNGVCKDVRKEPALLALECKKNIPKSVHGDIMLNSLVLYLHNHC